MKDRIGTIPHVKNKMTFHALAYALVQPKRILLDEPGGGQSQSRVLQDVVDQYLCDSDHADQIRDLMVEHFRDDWERHEDWKRIVSEGYGPKAADNTALSSIIDQRNARWKICEIIWGESYFQLPI